MKKLTINLITVLCAASGYGATITGSMLDICGSTTGSSVRFIPPGPLAIGTNTYLDYPRSATISNGLFQVSLAGGFYDAEFRPATIKPIRILVWPNDTNTYNFNTVAQLAVNAAMFNGSNITINATNGGSAVNAEHANVADVAGYATLAGSADTAGLADMASEADLAAQATSVTPGVTNAWRTDMSNINTNGNPLNLGGDINTNSGGTFNVTLGGRRNSIDPGSRYTLMIGGAVGSATNTSIVEIIGSQNTVRGSTNVTVVGRNIDVTNAVGEVIVGKDLVITNGNHSVTIGDGTNFITFDASGAVINGKLAGDGQWLTNINGSGTISLATSSAAGLMSTNLYAQAFVNPRLRRLANTPIPMGFAMQAVINPAYSNQNQGWALGSAGWLNTNKLTEFGYNCVLLNNGQINTNRDANGLLYFNTNFWPLGATGMVAAVTASNCNLGVFVEFNTNAAYVEEGYSAVVTPSTAYLDGYTMGKWGVRMVWVGDIGRGSFMSLPDVRYTFEMFSAGLDKATSEMNTPPVNIMASWTAISAQPQLGTNTYLPEPWCPSVINNMYVSYGDDIVTLKATGLIHALSNSLTQFRWLSDETCVRTEMGVMAINNGSAVNWMTTNLVRSSFGASCMGPMPLLITCQSLENAEWALITNRAAIAINQDPLYQPATVLSCTTSNMVVSRQLMNGDVAVGFFNVTTNGTVQTSISVRSIPGLRTNIVSVDDIFDHVISGATNTLSALVNTGGFNLYRLRGEVVESGPTTNVLVGTNTFYFNNGRLTGIVPVVASFDPASLSNLYFWHKADSIAYANGTKTNWSDSSGHGYTAGPATGLEPYYTNSVIGSKPAWFFTGNNELFTNMTYGVSSNFTCFVVAKPTADAPATGRVVDKVYSLDYTCICGPTTDQLNWHNSEADIKINEVSGAARAVCFMRDGPTVSLWNGTTNTTATVSAGTTVGGTERIGIGNKAESGTVTGIKGSIAEVIYYTDSMSGANVTNVLGYLKTKYGL